MVMFYSFREIDQNRKYMFTFKNFSTFNEYMIEITILTDWYRRIEIYPDTLRNIKRSVNAVCAEYNQYSLLCADFSENLARRIEELVHEALP